MYGFKLAVGLFAGLAVAQMSTPPTCSLNCFQKAIGQTSCGILDFFCQCTEGADVITKQTIECLCESEACSDSELADVRSYSNNVCEKALAASSISFTPVTYATDVCNAGTAAGTAFSAQATGSSAATGTTMMAGSNQTASAASGTGAAATASASTVPFEGAGARWTAAQGSVIGAVALAVLAL